MNSSDNKQPSQCFRPDNLPKFDASNLPKWGRQFLHSTLAGHKTIRRRHRRRCIDARHRDAVSSALPSLPADQESWHIVTKGNTPLWLTIPRLTELLSEPIAELKISTLGFGRDFADYLQAALRDGRIGPNYGIVCSHYFRSTSQGEFNLLAGIAGPRLAVARCHAKVIAATMQSGRSFVIEGSGNLRSCRSIEQMIVTQDTELARFHQSWITELLNGPPPNSAVRPL